MRQPRLVQGAAAALVAGALLMGNGAAAHAVTTPTVRIVSGTTCGTSAYCFRPATKTVASNTTVRWTNQTVAPHNVTRCTLGPSACPVNGGTGTDTGFGSGTLSGGSSYRFHFVGKGTYKYYCTIHGYAVLHGTITVT